MTDPQLGVGHELHAALLTVNVAKQVLVTASSTRTVMLDPLAGRDGLPLKPLPTMLTDWPLTIDGLVHEPIFTT